MPFFVLAVTLALQDVHRPPPGRPASSAARSGSARSCLYVAVVAATFVFFYPVLAGQPLTHAQWVLRMWFPSWF